MRKFFEIFVLGFAVTAIVSAGAGQAGAGILFQEHFNTDTTDTAATLAAYSPPFSYSGARPTLYVSGGVLHSTTVNSGTSSLFYIPGFSGDITVNVDIGKTPGGGQSNVCLVIGENNLVFHPGYPGGAFRVDGPGGFGNTDMGFTPVANVLYEMTVSIVAATGHFDIAIVDPNNSSNDFITTFTNTGYTPGNNIGFFGYGAAGDTALYADLVVTNASAVPEPSSFALLGLGGIGLAIGACRRRRATAV